MRRAAVALTLLLGSSAFAESLEGVGRISLLPGWRWTPNGHFAATAAERGHPLERASVGGPQLTATFAYAASDAIEVAIDLFAGFETLRLREAEPLTSVSYGALAGARAYWSLGRFAPYLGLGVGPVLVYTSGGLQTRPNERVTTGYAAMGGVSYRLTDTFAVTFDARALLARGNVAGVGGINGGGAWAGVGVSWLFAAEPGRTGAVR